MQVYKNVFVIQPNTINYNYYYKLQVNLKNYYYYYQYEKFFFELHL